MIWHEPASFCDASAHSWRLLDKRQSGVAPSGAISLAQWAFLIAVSISCSAYLTHLRFLGGDSVGRTASLALAEAIGGSFVFLGIPVLVSFLFPKRGRFAVRIIGLSMMLFLNWLAVADRAEPAAEFFSEVNDRRVEWKKDVSAQLESNGFYEPDLTKAERAMKAVKEKAQKFDGKTKAGVTALFGVNDQLLVLAQSYETQRKRFLDSGGTVASSIRTLEQLEAREAIIASCGKANGDMLRFIQDIDARLEAALANVDWTPDQREEAIQGYKKGASLDLVLGIRGLDQQVLEASWAVMSLLRKEWGRWRIQGDAVVFDSSAAAKEFNLLLGKIATAGKEQSELQRRLAK